MGDKSAYPGQTADFQQEVIEEMHWQLYIYMEKVLHFLPQSI